MADLIVGYPSNLTTVTAGTGGNIRVTYQPWELDWEFFDAIAVDGTHYLANITTAVSHDVIAKGGQENTGYWFEISLAFPDANWNSGNNITPQRQAAISQFATPAAAIAVLVNHDVLLAWNSTATNQFRGLGGTWSFSNKAGSIWGMMSRGQTLLGGQTGVITIVYGGNLAAQNQQVFIRNVTVFVGVYAIQTGPTVDGAGWRVTRCRFPRGLVLLDGANNTVQADNCCVDSAGTGLTFYRAALIYNNVVTRSGWGYQLGFRVHTMKNCVASDNHPDYRQPAGSMTYCADTDGTLPVAAGNLRNQNTKTQFRFFRDIASPGQEKFCHDPRIYRDSVLVGAGIAVAGLTTDADHVTRPNPPSMGPWEPRNVCYAPAGRMIRGLHKRGIKP